MDSFEMDRLRPVAFLFVRPPTSIRTQPSAVIRGQSILSLDLFAMVHWIYAVAFVVRLLLFKHAARLNKWATPDHGGDRRATL